MSAPSVSAPRSASASAVDGNTSAAAAQARGQLVEREHHAGQEQQRDEQGVGGGEAHERAEPAGEHERQPDERRHGQDQRRDQGHGLEVGAPPERQRGGHDHDGLQRDDDQHHQALRRHQARPAERGRTQALEHAVRPVEPGADGEVGERRGQHGERQRAGSEEVDGVAVDRQHVDQREEHEHGDRDAEGEQQRLAVAQRQRQVEPDLGEQRPHGLASSRSSATSPGSGPPGGAFTSWR